MRYIPQSIDASGVPSKLIDNIQFIDPLGGAIETFEAEIVGPIA
jgi:hypothetical protein